MDRLKGVGIAIVTPFMENGAVDYKAFERLIEHQIAGGVNYIVVQGTTGESATLKLEEKQQVLNYAIEVIKGRVPVVFGHGGNNTQALVDGFKQFDLSKVDAILSASPYYNKPTQEGIYQHYKALAEASPLPIILYNVPGRTASNMTAETTLRLANDFDNIIAMKEASGDLDQMSKIIKNKPENFLVLSGDDALVLPQMSIGADGVISVIGNALPKEFCDLVHSTMNGNWDNARVRHHQLADIIPLLFTEGNPAGVKAVLRMLGITSDEVRLPLVKMSKEGSDKLYKAISEAGVTLP